MDELPPATILLIAQEIRDNIYAEFIALELELIDKFETIDPAGHLGVTQRDAVDMRLGLLLTNKQLSNEFKSEWYGRRTWIFDCLEILAGPKEKLADHPRERCILQHAKKYLLRAHAGQWSNADQPTYSVLITILQHSEAGFELDWQHMSVDAKGYLKVSEAQYQAMVERTEVEIGAMVVGRRAVDKQSGFTWEGMQKAIDVFYLSDLVDLEDDEEHVEDTAIEAGGGQLPWDGPDLTVSPLFNW